MLLLLHLVRELLLEQLLLELLLSVQKFLSRSVIINLPLVTRWLLLLLLLLLLQMLRLDFIVLVALLEFDQRVSVEELIKVAGIAATTVAAGKAPLTRVRSFASWIVQLSDLVP